mmetsp:Transcript_33857/g.84371  ORF Transcript_33857/g.84371 Transcript_33857/m.84371 type:complete len:367 (-) Transcript_33857:150-1250(-)
MLHAARGARHVLPDVPEHHHLLCPFPAPPGRGRGRPPRAHAAWCALEVRYHRRHRPAGQLLTRARLQVHEHGLGHAARLRDNPVRNGALSNLPTSVLSAEALRWRRAVRRRARLRCRVRLALRAQSSWPRRARRDDDELGGGLGGAFRPATGRHAHAVRSCSLRRLKHVSGAAGQAAWRARIPRLRRPFRRAPGPAPDHCARGPAAARDELAGRGRVLGGCLHGLPRELLQADFALFAARGRGALFALAPHERHLRGRLRRIGRPATHVLGVRRRLCSHARRRGHIRVGRKVVAPLRGGRVTPATLAAFAKLLRISGGGFNVDAGRRGSKPPEVARGGRRAHRQRGARVGGQGAPASRAGLGRGGD